MFDVLTTQMQFLSIQSFAEFPDLMDDKWCKNPFYVIRLIVFFYFHKGTVYDKASDVAENKVQFASKTLTPRRMH